MMAKGGCFVQSRLLGLQTTYKPVLSWGIKQYCHTHHEATKGFGANSDMMPENSLVLILLSMSTGASLNHLLTLSCT